MRSLWWRLLIFDYVMGALDSPRSGEEFLAPMLLLRNMAADSLAVLRSPGLQRMKDVEERKPCPRSFDC
jgi:hypothetical protein